MPEGGTQCNPSWNETNRAGSGAAAGVSEARLRKMERSLAVRFSFCVRTCCSQTAVTLQEKVERAEGLIIMSDFLHREKELNEQVCSF